MRIAIVGLDDACLEDYDPNAWERRWHMGQDLWANATDVFELHPRQHWDQGERGKYLRRTDALVYTRKRHKDIGSLAYPIRAATKAFGRYFECTASYMLAAAILVKPRKIGIYGVSGDAECAEQRPNLEYLIGFGRGRGIKFEVSRASKLLTSAWESGVYGNMDRAA